MLELAGSSFSHPHGAVVWPPLVQVFQSVWICESLKELREDSRGASEVLAVACMLLEGYALNSSCLSSPRP